MILEGNILSGTPSTLTKYGGSPSKPSSSYQLQTPFLGTVTSTHQTWGPSLEDKQGEGNY